MKLLVICQYFYPEQFRVSDVCFQLADRGHEVTVLTGLPNYPAGQIFEGYQWDQLKHEQAPHAESFRIGKGKFLSQLNAYQEEINGVRVLRARLLPRKTGMKNLALNYGSFAWWASKTALKIAKDKHFEFDKILVVQFSPVTMALPGILLKRKLRKPLIFYTFDLWPESIVSAGLPNHGPIYFSILKLSQWIYRKADLILTSSKNFRSYFKTKLDLQGPFDYLPIYAEDLFQMPPDRIMGTESKTGIDLVFAGNLGEMQSLDTIIKAAGRLRANEDIRFHFVGDGSAMERSKQLASRLNPENIFFHGRHPLGDMPRFYAMADAFLITLKRDDFISYTLPGKVQSYMAAGKPILAAIDGETAEVIREANCGLCCAAEDEEALAGIILQFSQERAHHRTYGENAKAYYDANFSSEAFFQKLLQVLNEVV